MLRLITLFLSLNVLFLACKPSIPKGYTKLSEPETVFASPYFNDSAVDYIYKSSVEAYGRTFGGILIIKKITDTDFRVVMTTEFGNRIFDFQIGQNFRKNFVLEPLDKKIIINTLKRDFELLLKQSFAIQSKYVNGRDSLRVNRENSRTIFLFTNEELYKVSSFKNSNLKLELVFEKGISDYVESINLSHKNIKLKINLTKYQN